MSKKTLFLLASMLTIPGLANAQDAKTLKLYENTLAGEMTITGNAIGLSYERGYACLGDYDGIGAFMAIKKPLAEDEISCPSGHTSFSSFSQKSWSNGEEGGPQGVTKNWGANGSMAYLDLPDDAEIVHAELVWAGSYKATVLTVKNSKVTNEVVYEDIGSLVSTPVVFRNEDLNLQTTVTPSLVSKADYRELKSATGYDMFYYTNSADVTSFFKSTVSGQGTAQ